MSIMNKRTILKLIAACVCLTGATAIFTACTKNAPGFASIDLTGANYARDFALTDHNGQPKSLKDFAGKVVVIFFGYVQCPDVCPTSMTEMAEAKKLLGKDGERLQGLFITVDPERDTPAVLKSYMAAFDPTFLALYTTPEKTAALAKEYKIYYRKVDGPTATSYSIDHSAGNYVYDAQGKLRLYTRYASGAEVLAADIKLLLKQAQ